MPPDSGQGAPSPARAKPRAWGAGGPAQGVRTSWTLPWRGVGTAKPPAPFVGTGGFGMGYSLEAAAASRSQSVLSRPYTPAAGASAGSAPPRRTVAAASALSSPAASSHT